MSKITLTKQSAAPSNPGTGTGSLFLQSDGSLAVKLDTGTLLTFVTGDHASTHLPNGTDALATGVPVAIGTANAEGTANAFARQDHVHDHNNLAGGLLHAAATTSLAGFMSAADKTKLDGLPSSFVFGTGFDSEQSLAISTTTSTTFQTKVTFSYTPPAAGKYLLLVSYGWNHDATNSDFEARVQQDAVTLGQIHKQEPQDSGGGDPTGTDQRYLAMRYYLLDFTTTTAKSFTLQYRTDDAGDESSIWDAYLCCFRVS